MLSVIRTGVSLREYDTWFAPTEFGGAEDDAVVIQVPNAMFAKRLEREYRDRILGALRAAGSPLTSVRCSISEDSDGARKSSGSAAETPTNHRLQNRELASRSDRLRPDFSFESFVVGTTNRCAHGAALDVSGAGVEYSPYNPLLIYGNAGLGKTHLLHSIARRFLELNPKRRVFHARGVEFSRHVVTAALENDLDRFREECASLDLLLLDDIQFIPGLDRFSRSAAELFHALTALPQRGRQVVLTADTHPRDIHNLDPRIKSRLECGLTTDLGPPDWETRTAIVRRKATDLGVELPDGVPETLASRYQNSVPELEGPLKNLMSESRTRGIEISQPLLDRVLTKNPSQRTRRPSIHEVQLAVAKDFGVAPLGLRGPQRSQALVLARHVAMFLCRETTGRTLQDIGREFRRDHSTVTYAVHRIAQQRQRDLGLDRMLKRLLSKLA